MIYTATVRVKTNDDAPICIEDLKTLLEETTTVDNDDESYTVTCLSIDWETLKPV
jgi:hypothetical protein